MVEPGAVEAYIAQHSLDERCAEQLRALAPAEQSQVMQTDVSAARNVSAVVSSNVQKAMRAGSSLAVPLGPSYPPQPNYAPLSRAPAAQPMPHVAMTPQYRPAQPLVQPGAVEAYIAQHSLDERCAAKLKALAPAAQFQVMQIDVSAARNVSAVVSSNIQKASAGAECDPVFARHEHMFQQEMMMQPMLSAHRPVGRSQTDMALLGAVEVYIAQHSLDERCVAKLRALPLASQLQVMQTDVSAARNVSAVVSSLCNAIPPPEPVEAYIAEHHLDERCATQLKSLAPAEQSQVMQTDVSAARNMSAVVSSNIQKVSGRSGTKRARDEAGASNTVF